MCEAQGAVELRRLLSHTNPVMREGTRRDFLRAASLGFGVGLAGCSSSEDEPQRIDTDSDTDKTVYQLNKLEEVLVHDDLLEQEFGHMFVGNPNFYDYNFSTLEATRNEGSGDEDPRDIFEKAADERGVSLEKLIDESLTDPIEYDILVNDDLNVLVYHEGGVSDDAIGVFSDQVRDLTGIEPDIELASKENLSKEFVREMASEKDDALVYGFISGLENIYGRSDPGENFIEMNSDQAVGDNPLTASNSMIHEFLHGAVNLPHIPVGKEFLMFRSPQSPAEVRASQQTNEMARRYISSELDFWEDEGQVYVAGFEPRYTIDDGEEYLLKNTEWILNFLEFPVERYDLSAEGEKAVLERGDYRAEIYPSSETLYDRVDIMER